MSALKVFEYFIFSQTPMKMLCSCITTEQCVNHKTSQVFSSPTSAHHHYVIQDNLTLFCASCIHVESVRGPGV